MLVSLLAHAVTYGTSHLEGGAFHQAFLGLAALAIAGFTARVFALACSGRGYCLQGSVLAAKLAGTVPGRSLLAVVSLGWFALGESLEPAHAVASIVIVMAVILVVVLVVRELTLASLRAIARIVIAIATIAFAPRLQAWARRVHARSIARRIRFSRRRFARPPPGTMLHT